MPRSYYTLIASLPQLPHFTRAERLPINRERLRERLLLLDPEDFMIIQHSSDFLAWQRQPVGRSAVEMAGYFEKLHQAVEPRRLWPLFEFPANVRTVMAGLRRRQQGKLPPDGKEIWGVGPWVRHIERHWEVPDFNLTPIFPWINEARGLLQNREALALENLLMNLVWRHVEWTAPSTEFTLETVLAYIFKWDMVNLWLTYNAEAGRTRFEELVTGVLETYGRLFE